MATSKAMFLAPSIPGLSREADAAVKALIGLAIILASVKVQNELAKTALVGVGVGIAAGALSPFLPVPR